MDDRRVADENFRRELAERMKALEIEVRESRGEIKETRAEIMAVKMSQMDLHYTLFGGPEPDKAGLLERFRSVALRDRWIVWLVAAAIGFLGKLASPLYSKWVADWAYNSVSEKWKREQERPKIRHYHIIQKVEPNE